MEHILNNPHLLLAIFDLIVIVVASIISYNIGHSHGHHCAINHDKKSES